ncbi:hypothetical protein Tco_0800487 [Tanacetum coccineum]|uniref:Uncharacterized protein n=1 Tax=Tanacetum coccineum TaxID=301880 RepID=A0ABQ4ZTC3_9ASTR
MSRLENPYENVNDPKEINESFPLETLKMVSFRGDSRTRCGLPTLQNTTLGADVCTAMKLLRFLSALPQMDSPGDISWCKPHSLKKIFDSDFGCSRAIISDAETHFCNGDQFAKVMPEIWSTHVSHRLSPQTSWARGSYQIVKAWKRILKGPIGENVPPGSGYHQKDRKPSQNDKTEHEMEKTVQNQGQSPKMPKSESILKNTVGCNLNPSDGPGKPNSISMKTVKTKWALNHLQQPICVQLTKTVKTLKAQS